MPRALADVCTLGLSIFYTLAVNFSVMKWSVKFTISIIAMVTFLPCCKKDQNIVAESAPVANAGPDQAITLPVDSVFLDGSQSEDVNGNISTYKWEKIAGPSIFNIKNSTAAKTWTIGLVEGSLQI